MIPWQSKYTTCTSILHWIKAAVRNRRRSKSGTKN